MSDAVSAALVPGWNARRRSPELAVGLLVLGWGAPLAVVAWALWQRRAWVALTLDTGFLALVVVAGVAAIAARAIALGEVWFAHGRPVDLSWRNVVAVGVALAVVAPLGYGTVTAGQARAGVAPIFAGHLDVPLFDAAAVPRPVVHVPAPVTVASTAAPVATAVPTPSGPGRWARLEPEPVTARPGCASSGIGAAAHPDVATILLLGGDAGPGRAGLRTDTMMLFSIHRPSGRAALISVPRNLLTLRFPPDSELGRRYPGGWTDLANAVYPIVQSKRELREAYDDVPGVAPGVVALAQGLGCSLDVTIDDYVLIDMRGFVALVDALGGVSVNVPKAVPMPGNIPNAPSRYPDWIGPGTIWMDGSTALGYARSRKGDSDYQRTTRQRTLLAALAQQVSLGDVLGSYQAVASALGESLRTSLSPDELAGTLAVIGGETAIVESVGLVPPLVNVNHPDWDQMARVVAEVQVALTTGSASGW